MALIDLPTGEPLQRVLDVAYEAGNIGEDLADWGRSNGFHIAQVIILALIAVYAIRRLVPVVVKRGVHRRPLEPDLVVQKRIDTLVGVFQHTAVVAVVVIAILMILPDLGLNITPLLAGLGITGLALGLGAQSLVRDVVNGVFILLEDQYAIGDVITVANVTGRVEEINLRRTVIRHIDTGVVYSIPNSSIAVSGNLTRGWSGIDLNVSVAYDEDLDRAKWVIDQVGRDLAADPAFGPRITSPPRVERVEALEDAGVILKVHGGTKPGAQWDVTGELRARIKAAFEREGIRRKSA